MTWKNRKGIPVSFFRNETPLISSRTPAFVSSLRLFNNYSTLVSRRNLELCSQEPPRCFPTPSSWIVPSCATCNEPCFPWSLTLPHLRLPNTDYRSPRCPVVRLALTHNCEMLELGQAYYEKEPLSQERWEIMRNEVFRSPTAGHCPFRGKHCAEWGQYFV